ncbi:MAG: 6-phosphofructokinase [Candidatus Syntrophoarchaeum caldarius]|uniref:ATP-dependent 6-phosphofructokinase n=1 Tax=Candidatus Syntropharchaeum caldarium TaxID=1838285 RepID=A0A1F2P9H7_9EURY|nr:MAG: 6-phosphofructokinase [Candidatus Syntrophoarchaeum caldarius]
MKTIGVLTGGGDCPGLNAAIRAVVKQAIIYDWEVIGIRNGWKGLIEGDVEPLTHYSVSGILSKGGTILGTSRVNPTKNIEDLQRLRDNIKKYGISGIIACGGEGTLSAALALYRRGIPVVGIPKTIDNDVSCTSKTIGFDTAVTIATDAIDRLHTTAESHHRVIIIEVMGRHVGWIAMAAGIAGGANEILIPEVPFDIEEICENLKQRYDHGKAYSTVVVAEGAIPKEGTGFRMPEQEIDEYGHVKLGGIGYLLKDEIEKRVGVDVRVTILGHIQRGGSPTPFDRILATRMGITAVKLLKDEDYGKMVALRGSKILPVKLEDAVAKLKTVDLDLFDLAKTFFG